MAQRSRLLVHVAALRRGAAAPALHTHQSPHAHLVRGPRQSDALRHAADVQGLALRHQRTVYSQVPVAGALAARDQTIHAAHAGSVTGGGAAEDDPQRASLLPRLPRRHRSDRLRLRLAGALVLRAAAAHRRPDHADVQHHPARRDAGELDLHRRQHKNVSDELGGPLPLSQHEQPRGASPLPAGIRRAMRPRWWPAHRCSR